MPFTFIDFYKQYNFCTEQLIMSKIGFALRSEIEIDEIKFYEGKLVTVNNNYKTKSSDKGNASTTIIEHLLFVYNQ